MYRKNKITKRLMLFTLMFSLSSLSVYGTEEDLENSTVLEMEEILEEEEVVENPEEIMPTEPDNLPDTSEDVEDEVEEPENVDSSEELNTDIKPDTIPDSKEENEPERAESEISVITPGISETVGEDTIISEEKPSRNENKEEKKEEKPEKELDILTTDMEKDDIETEPNEEIRPAEYVPAVLPSKDIIRNQLKALYGINVSEDFGMALNQAERKLYEVECIGEDFMVRNWKDVLAVFLYKYGKDVPVIDCSLEPQLYEILYSMNVQETDPKNHIRNNRSYTEESSIYTEKKLRELDMLSYARENGINISGMLCFSSEECLRLISEICASTQTIRAYVGNEISTDKVNVISAALSLTGKVSYFYGGKYPELGKNMNWGIPMLIEAEGADSTGQIRDYGLDCSGFVQWSLINGTGRDLIGDGTSEQWEHTYSIAVTEVQPGYLMFKAGPEATGAANHVGIVIGKDVNGNIYVVHSSSAAGGVTVSDSGSAQLYYARRIHGI